MKKLFFLQLILSPFIVFSQDENLRYEDWTYLHEIRSVKFHVAGLLTTLPVLDYAAGSPLELSFDLLNDEALNFTYTVVHCDANWQPSRLSELEYLDGFTEDRIEEFDFSFKAKSIFVNYYLELPNEDMRFTKSGNYLLKVYLDEDVKTLAFTRRFMVVEPFVKIKPYVSRPAIVSKQMTHQEVDFVVFNKDYEIRNPRQELTATVLQNGRWDCAVSGVPPFLSRQDEQSFEYQDKFVFPAGKEFRPLDLRSIRYPDPRIVSVEIVDGVYEVVLEKDGKRGEMSYFETNDLDGNFIIESNDDPDPYLQNEYVSVLFTLYSPGEMDGYDLYIFGGLSEWHLNPAFKMVYNPAVNGYVGKVLLKQGFYDYVYAAVPKGTGKPDFEVTEGNSYETDNSYTILIYYRPFGSRFDQLIGIRTFSSRM